MEQSEPVISFLCRVKSSSVEENAKIKDSIIITKCSGPAFPNIFAKYSSDLEEFLKLGGWASINTQEQRGEWVVVFKDPATRKGIATLKRCKIMNINLTCAKEGSVVVGLKIQHQKSLEQPALEDAVSTEVIAELSLDTELFEQIQKNASINEAPVTNDRNEPLVPEIPPIEETGGCTTERTQAVEPNEAGKAREVDGPGDILNEEAPPDGEVNLGGSV